jgi:BirA family transcriptional regulator, biotin operon repressor / biotin---[acetyl-CoA-carboxylase] ligase
VIPAWPEGVGQVVLPTVDSTSLEAARQARDIAGPTWFLGLQQTAAKGRRGRAWSNPPGNFAASLVYRPGGAIATRALRSFVASLALQDALIAATGRAEGFRLKWPNDVLLNGGKLAGILLEGGPADTLIIGIGVNLRAAPTQAQVETGALAPVSLLSETGTDITPEAFLDLLAPAFAAVEDQFVTYGFDAVRTRWLANAAKLGEPIHARTVAETHHGTFETVDAEGQLVLRTAAGQRMISAGDVFF